MKLSILPHESIYNRNKKETIERQSARRIDASDKASKQSIDYTLENAISAMNKPLSIVPDFHACLNLLS